MEMEADIKTHELLRYIRKISYILMVVIVILMLYLVTIRGDFGFKRSTIGIILSGNLMIFIHFKFGDKIFKRDDLVVLDLKNLSVTMILVNTFSILLATLFSKSTVAFIIPITATLIIFYIMSLYHFKLKEKLEDNAENP